MERTLTLAETVIAFLPMVLPIAFFVVLRARPQYGFTESGKRYLKVDVPTRVPLLSTRLFWLLFAASLAAASAWALGEAVISAVHSGTVSLPGQRRHPRPVVSWVAAWSYLAGLVFLLVSTLLPRLPGKASLQGWFTLAALVMGVTGYALVLLSPLLSSWRGVGVLLLGLVVSVGVHRLVRKRSAGGETNGACPSIERTCPGKPGHAAHVER